MIDYTRPLEELPDPLPIEPLDLGRPFDVTITPPGSKSITCRAYVLAALADPRSGESRLIRPLRADDTDRLLEALCTLGAEAKWVPGAPGSDGSEDVIIRGVGGRFPRGGRVYLGDGGTPTRFMIACACLAAEPVVVDASPRMRERPIAEGIEMLRQLGARIEYVEEEGRLPVRVVPNTAFRGGELEIGRTQSSQFISALMLMAPWIDRGLTIRFNDEPTSRAYVTLTQMVLRHWGYEVQRGGNQIVMNRRGVHAREFLIEADASSAAFWFAAAATVPRSRVTIEHLDADSIQPDMEVHGILVRDGGLDDSVGTHGHVLWNRGALRPLRISGEACPDGVIALAAAAATARGRSTLSGLRTLRVKETDRIAALARELRKVGCAVASGEDWIEITPPREGPPQGPPEVPSDAPHSPHAHGQDARATGGRSGSLDAGGAGIRPDPEGRGSIKPLIIETYNDHRMAMAFAVLGLAAPGGRRLAIRNPACVRKSYPTFWKDFAKLYQ
jgi:3-phosphoshikimate 1-carboxyvinyltransferase